MTFDQQDEHWMRHALHLAKHAATQNEVPVGAVLILNNTIIGEGFNQPISTNDPTAHAEIIALRQGAQSLENYRLCHSTLYVTLEPCMMCMGALVHARIHRLVFGAFDHKTGIVKTQAQLAELPCLNHRVICEGGVLDAECGDLLSGFFREKRKR